MTITLDDFLNSDVDLKLKFEVAKVVTILARELSNAFKEFVKKHEEFNKELSRKLIREMDKAVRGVKNIGELLGDALWCFNVVSSYYGVQIGVGIYTKVEDELKNASIPDWIDKQSLVKLLRVIQMCMYAQFLPSVFGNPFER